MCVIFSLVWHLSSFSFNCLIWTWQSLQIVGSSRPFTPSLKKLTKLLPLTFVFHILLFYLSEPSLVVNSHKMSMSHSISQHFSHFLLFISTVNIIVIIIILIISFWDVTKVFNGFFYTCNTIFILVWGLIFHNVLQIWVKFLSVLFWDFLANIQLQINSKDKSRDTSHTTFKMYLKKYFQKQANSKCKLLLFHKPIKWKLKLKVHWKIKGAFSTLPQHDVMSLIVQLPD